MGVTLVTGGTGLVGTNLVRTLVAQGEQVRVLLRRSSNRAGFQGVKIEEAVGDVTDLDSVRRAMQGVAKVYHVAAKVNLGPFARADLMRTNVTGTQNVCQAAVEAGVTRMVHTSTVSTVGQGTMAAPADESSFYEAFDVNCPYWTSKLMAELVVLDYVNRRGLAAVIVNPSFVLGAWDMRPNSGAVVLLAARLGGLPCYATGGLNVVDVDDVVAGHIAAMDKGKVGKRYLLANENLSHKDFLTKIATTLNLRPPRMPLPWALAKPSALVADALGQWFPEQFTNWNSLFYRISTMSQFVDGSVTRNELGIPCTPIEHSIQQTYDWFKSQGRL